MMTVNLNHRTSGGNVPYEYDCGTENENTFKEVNGAYSPANDATYFGKVNFSNRDLVSFFRVVALCAVCMVFNYLDD